MVKKYSSLTISLALFDQKIINVTFCILFSVLLVSCTSPSIYRNKSFNPPVYFGQHVVQPGDTLYRIAWRYGRELKELAATNNIDPPYVIRPGQKISLEKSPAYVAEAKKSARKHDSRERNVTKSKNNVSDRKSVTKDKKYNNFKNIKWSWPHVGPIIAKYYSRSSRNLDGLAQGVPNKGIDISGQIGDPIFAAADGEVVYAGNGLLGYGNLVIINHNEHYLSAYAHNRKILVKEGQIIKIGQKIAEMGSSESQQTKLHFEIRRDGQPVDPLKYLPK
ncbi:MAG: peptidoglycan DD-metalloendopeptidase family protein [Oleiphilus sp.]